TDRGTITGTVIDPANALIPGASVTAHNDATGAEYKTDTTQTGNYTIPSLPAGIYSMSAEAAGFKKATVANLQVEVAQEVRQDIKLEVGSATESITVQAESVLLKTEN